MSSVSGLNFYPFNIISSSAALTGLHNHSFGFQLQVSHLECHNDSNMHARPHCNQPMHELDGGMDIDQTIASSTFDSLRNFWCLQPQIFFCFSIFHSKMIHCKGLALDAYQTICKSFQSPTSRAWSITNIFCLSYLGSKAPWFANNLHFEVIYA